MAQLVKTFGSLAIASVKTAQGLAIASAKTIMGVDNTGGGTPALITSGGAASSNTNDVSVTINATGANFISCVVGNYNGSSITVSDPTNGSYTGLTAKPGGSEAGIQIFYHQGGTYGSGLVITASGTGVYPSMRVAAFSNMSSSPFDQQNGATGGTVATLQPGSITPSQANTVVIVGLGMQDIGAGVPAIDGGYTLQGYTLFNSGVSEGSAIAYKILTSASAQNPTWSVVGGFEYFVDSSSVIASFKY